MMGTKQNESVAGKCFDFDEKHSRTNRTGDYFIRVYFEIILGRAQTSVSAANRPPARYTVLAAAWLVEVCFGTG